MNVTDAMRVALGGSPEKAEARRVDRNSPGFFHDLIEYYYRRAKPTSEDWEVARAEYSSEMKGWKREGDSYQFDELRPSRAYSIVSTIESMVMSNRPKFFISSFTASEDTRAVPIFEQSLNNEWRDDFRLVGESRLCVRDCAKYGFGVMLTSFEAEYDPEEQDEAASELREMHTEDPILAAAASVVESEIAAQKNLAEPPLLASTYENDSRVVYGKVISRRVSPWDILIDPDCTSEDDARWMGRRIVADLDAVKADPLLKNTEKLYPTGAMSSDGNFRSFERNPVRDQTCPIDLVHLYEIFIRRPNGGWDMKLLAANCNVFLREIEMPYWIGCPYDFLRWNQDGEQFFPKSDIQYTMSEIVAERMLLTKVYDGYAREHVDTTFYDDRLGISEEELYADADPVVGKWVKCSPNSANGNMPFQNYFYKPQKDSKSPEAMNILAIIERSMQVSSGFSPNQFGQALKSGTTATEAAEVSSSARGRGSNKYQAVEEFLANVAKKRMGLMAQFYDAADIGRLAGPEAASMWSEIDWTKADVQHGLGIGVEPGSTRAVTEESRINQVVTFLGVVNQDPVMRAAVNVPEVLKELFRLFGFNNGSKFLNIQDGQQFGNMAAEFDAMSAGGGRSTAGAGARGGSPPAVPGASGAQALGATL